MMDKVALNILAEADTQSLRTETFQGREFLVVPVIALVEGVLHSANAADPELALASEFGKFPNAWDGRPLVMNHPFINGSYVSANSPKVLEEWSFGQLFNSTLLGSKLKTEAWIDLQKAEALGGDVLQTINRIQSGDLVEVSTGLFAMVEEVSGLYNNERYSGIWRSIAPDHLAFLSEGSIGACSVEDGCGVPRLNQAEILQNYPNLRMNAATLKTVKPSAHKNCDCGCRGTCEGGTPVNARNNAVDNERLRARVQNLIPCTIPEDMPVDNVRKLLRSALANIGIDLWELYTFTTAVVIYERFESTKIFQRSYSIDGEGRVTLGDDEVEVNLLTKIAPVVNSADSAGSEEDKEDEEDDKDDNLSASAAHEDPEPPNSNVEHTMTKTVKGNAAATGAIEAAESTPQVQEPTESTTPETIETAQATQVAPEPHTQQRPLTINQYIAQAPAEVQEVLNESIRLHAEKKNQLVQTLLKTNRCDFSETTLRTMSISDLEKLNKLAAVPTYAGQSAPRVHTEDNSPPPAPIAFPSKRGQAS